MAQVSTLGASNNIYTILYIYKLFINTRDSTWMNISIISNTYTIITHTVENFYEELYNYNSDAFPLTEISGYCRNMTITAFPWQLFFREIVILRKLLLIKTIIQY